MPGCNDVEIRLRFGKRPEATTGIELLVIGVTAADARVSFGEREAKPESGHQRSAPPEH
jgi:hypothetical protein